MITLINNVTTYNPDPMGQQTIALGGEHILGIDPDLTFTSSLHQTVIDGSTLIAIPGFVDSLVHICGGGGEDGFASRTPEMMLSDAITAGITTVVGALGTDSIGRTHSNLLAKAKGLKEEGLNAFCYTGAYHLPAPSLTGSIEKDIMFIDEVIGVGEVAISDHRGSQLDAKQLSELAAHARVAGMLSNKRGTISIHVGPSDSHLALLHEVAAHHDVPLNRFYPTHMNRNQQLLDAGIAFANAGGWIDFTTSTTDYDLAHGEVSAARALAQCLAKGVEKTRLTMSSDGHASLPVFDENNHLVGLEVGHERSLLLAFIEAVKEHKVAFADALRAITSNPANVLGIQKGTLAAGACADLVLLDSTSLLPRWVFVRGQCMMADGELIRKGRFE
ncbi:beta-aspartyl-peptidase [Pseudoalteromonas sp. CNC9-20]|uniref:beta-aspartyl-peptidase n=1 Tax=Pseudoalteromonas sp. CNC9-20 TaxID=2917750 RepID=UPI001EF6C381|nr:beta-aspartyl-peptidase [Pseudoalteromonas sp. CNC9-20]MCG7569365.1 beta-aspartyl-peptidase [Pseudoalteromonas sp. CNC9-20]